MGRTVQVWVYITESNPDKALKEVEKLIDDGLKHSNHPPKIHYVAEVLK